MEGSKISLGLNISLSNEYLYEPLKKYKIITIDKKSDSFVFNVYVKFTEEGHNFYLRALSESLKSI